MNPKILPGSRENNNYIEKKIITVKSHYFNGKLEKRPYYLQFRGINIEFINLFPVPFVIFSFEWFKESHSNFLFLIITYFHYKILLYSSLCMTLECIWRQIPRFFILANNDQIYYGGHHYQDNFYKQDWSHFLIREFASFPRATSRRIKKIHFIFSLSNLLLYSHINL